MKAADISAVASIHNECFMRQILSQEWITANFHAYP
ncbi:Uncharacterised protein [Legionella pneumophila]|nr:Uncharacterised protein [Legionella pneumophila]